jgi:hypothetical protein
MVFDSFAGSDVELPAAYQQSLFEAKPATAELLPCWLPADGCVAGVLPVPLLAGRTGSAGGHSLVALLA